MQKFKQFVGRAALVGGTVLASGAAMAQDAADVTAATGALASAATAIGAVGAAMVTAAAAGIVYRWVTAMFESTFVCIACALASLVSMANAGARINVSRECAVAGRIRLRLRHRLRACGTDRHERKADKRENDQQPLGRAS